MADSIPSTGESSPATESTDASGAGTAASGRTLGQKADRATSGRIGAYLVDFTLLSIASVVAFVVTLLLGGLLAQGAMGAGSPSSGSTMLAAVGLLMAAAYWGVTGAMVLGYFTVLDATGGTLGKRIVGIEVVDGDESAVGMKETGLRSAVLVAPLPVMAIAWVLLIGVSILLAFVVAVGIMAAWLAVEGGVMLLSDDSRRLGDRAAGTYVVGD